MRASPSRETPLYSERVRAAAWFHLLAGVLVLALAVTLIVALAVDFDPVALVVSLVALPLVLLVLYNFSVLTIDVTRDAVRFGFGPISRRIPLAEIEAVEAAGYRWLDFGGWGIRFALGGRRAWSVPGPKRCVIIWPRPRDGKQRSYYVSSRRPEELAIAIERVRAAIS